ncbi:transposase family protein [Streptomyces sp. NPDC086077]|uniref:transposase family protein n=1 Tax=Streptomyces sp. NPDC086077 TaxID=3154862 RepID=UPI00341B41DE
MRCGWNECGWRAAWSAPPAPGELTVACPDCGRSSARVHSGYCRTLADVSVGGRPVLNGLSVRRWFCDSPGCAHSRPAGA